MSALAHFLEDEGVATAVISLVRYQSDAVGPPRALWVPFELGRPLGEPGDAAFQRNVLKAMFELFGEASGPVTHEYEVDAPNSLDDPEWHAPDLSGAATVSDELAALASLHEAFLTQAGRTTVGVSGLALDVAATFVESYPDGEPPPAMDGVSDVMRLRFAADDLKAHYLEAASAAGGRPSSQQLSDWLWKSTKLGEMLLGVHAKAVDHSDRKFQTVGGRFVVPTSYR